MVDIEIPQTTEGESNYKIAEKLFDLQKNLEGKTELHDPEIDMLMRRYFFAQVFSNKGIELDKLNNDLAQMFMKLRVSKERKGRGEAVDLGKTGIEQPTNQNSYWKNYLGIR